MAFTTVAVTATYKKTDGALATGKVHFRLTQAMANGTDIRFPTDVTGTLVNGALAVSLPAVDDVGTQPVGVTYTVIEVIDGATPRTWQLALHAQASVDLGNVAPALSGAAVYGYALDKTVVHNTGNEPVGGIKTFTDPPVVPAASFTEDSLSLSTFVPADYGLKAWTFDPVMWASGLVMSPAGTLYWQRIHIRKAITINQLVVFVNTAGVGLVAGQCFGLIYGPTPGFTLLAWTGDQSVNWQSTGYKAMGLNTSNIAIPVGDIFTAFYYNGTTGPAFGRAGGSNIINGISTTAVTRFGTAQTGITTVAPGALSGMAAFNAAYWAALA